MSRKRDGRSRVSTLEVGNPDPVVLGDKTDDIGWFCLMTIRKQFKKSFSDEVNRERLVAELGIGESAVEAPFEFPNISLHFPGDEEQDVFGNIPSERAALLSEDGASGFQVRRLNVRQKTLEETSPETFLETGNIGGFSIGSEDDLAAR